jgi:hypothetical protein
MLRNGLFACPVCGLSMQDMDWAALDREVAQTPMPREYARLHRHILCKDCNSPSTALFHIVGMKCAGCGSYNTAVDKGPLLVAEEGEAGGFRPLTEAEEKALSSATFPSPEPDEGAAAGGEEEEEEEGWETTEEEVVEGLREEELD